MLCPGKKGQGRSYPESEVLIVSVVPTSGHLGPTAVVTICTWLYVALAIVFNSLSQFPYSTCQGIFLASYYSVSL